MKVVLGEVELRVLGRKGREGREEKGGREGKEGDR